MANIIIFNSSDNIAYYPNIYNTTQNKFVKYKPFVYKDNQWKLCNYNN